VMCVCVCVCVCVTVATPVCVLTLPNRHAPLPKRRHRISFHPSFPSIISNLSVPPKSCRLNVLTSFFDSLLPCQRACGMPWCIRTATPAAIPCLVNSDANAKEYKAASLPSLLSLISSSAIELCLIPSHLSHSAPRHHFV